VIRSERVAAENAVKPATIVVSDGCIEAIGGWSDLPAGIPLRDFGTDVVMPGIVDSHVHVNEPGRTDWEGFETATRAAAAGGITTIIDMPLNSIPATTTAEAVAAKVAAMDGKCAVDVGLWGGAVPENIDQLREVRDAGVLGFKCFLVESGVPEFGYLNREDLQRAVRAFDKLGVPLLVHAELGEDLVVPPPSESPVEYATYLESRPRRAEDSAIEMLCELAAGLKDVRLHIVHLSSASAIPIIEAARRNGIAISVETTPHYLTLRAEEIPERATQFKCAPPIRDDANRQKLWDALRQGVIDLVVSDHSPSPPELKESGDFMKSWGGISSLQLTLPVIWSEAADRDFKEIDLVRWMCEGPARLAGLDRRKGTITPGADADLAIWSPESAFVVDDAMIEHRHKLNPYKGRALRGVVLETMLRGETIYAHGEHVGAARGSWIRTTKR
jgi:allantoinase